MNGIKVIWRRGSSFGVGVSRSTTPGGPYTWVGSGWPSDIFVDTSVTPGITYYYEVDGSPEVAGMALPHAQAFPLSPPVNVKAWAPHGYAFKDNTLDYKGIYLRWCKNPAQE